MANNNNVVEQLEEDLREGMYVTEKKKYLMPENIDVDPKLIGHGMNFPPAVKKAHKTLLIRRSKRFERHLK
jgi:hypothetical protein